MRIKQSILARVKLVFILIAVFGGLIAIQIINIQWVQGSHWKQVAQEIGLMYRIKKAARGNIYSVDGELLATSIPLYKLSIDPTIVSETNYAQGIDSLSKLLAAFFEDKSPREYLLKINDARRQKKRYLVLSPRLITFTDKKEMSQWPIFKEGQLGGGVLFEKMEDRSYPFGELAKRTIGFVNENGKGAGLEISFDKELAGKDGKALYQKIIGGEWKPVNEGTQIRPQNGYDIQTTLDVSLQDLAHQTLRKALIQHDAANGCVVVMEVKTGEIKAMVNLGRIKQGEYLENYNYAIGDQGSDDPGSTFKTASMMALLEDTTLTLRDTIETGGGSFRYFDRVMRDTHYGGWGRITVQQALELSSNIGVSRLVSRHFGRKSEKYIQYLEKFGLATPLEKNIRIDGTAKPYIKNPRDNTWSGVTLPWMSVGYEMRVSPLQILMFYNAIANNGYLVKPLLVKKIKKTGQSVEEFKAEILKDRICSELTLNSIKTMLEGVVLRGTAKNIQTKQFSIAGKTGTSQKLNRRGQYIKKYKTSFAGYFPSDNPKYSCIVVIDEPQGADQYGADVSAPVFKTIAEVLYARDVDVQSQKILKRETSLYQTNLPTNQISHYEDAQVILQTLKISSVKPEDGTDWVSPQPQRLAVTWEGHKIEPNKVPNVKGLSLRDALYVLENRGLKVFYSGRGRVKTQSLMPGSVLTVGSKIIIQLE